MFVWAVLVVVVTTVLLAIEAALPRFPSISPASVDLETRVFPERGFSISYPAQWTVRETRNRVSFVEAAPTGGKPTRGMRIARSDIDVEDVAGRVEDVNAGRFQDYRVIATERRIVDRRDASVIVFAGDGLRFEQWWVDLANGTLRCELWSPLADDDAVATNQRIVRTLRLL